MSRRLATRVPCTQIITGERLSATGMLCESSEREYGITRCVVRTTELEIGDFVPVDDTVWGEPDLFGNAAFDLSDYMTSQLVCERLVASLADVVDPAKLLLVGLLFGSSEGRSRVGLCESRSCSTSAIVRFRASPLSVGAHRLCCDASKPDCAAARNSRRERVYARHTLHLTRRTAAHAIPACYAFRYSVILGCQEGSISTAYAVARCANQPAETEGTIGSPSGGGDIGARKMEPSFELLRYRRLPENAADVLVTMSDVS